MCAEHGDCHSRSLAYPSGGPKTDFRSFKCVSDNWNDYGAPNDEGRTILGYSYRQYECYKWSLVEVVMGWAAILRRRVSETDGRYFFVHVCGT